MQERAIYYIWNTRKWIHANYLIRWKTKLSFVFICVQKVSDDIKQKHIFYLANQLKDLNLKSNGKNISSINKTKITITNRSDHISSTNNRHINFITLTSFSEIHIYQEFVQHLEKPVLLETKIYNGISMTQSTRNIYW